MANKQTNRFEGDVYFAASSEPSIYGTGSMSLEGDLMVDGSVTVIGGVNAAHSSLSGLSLDDHTQYLLLEGRTGGQIVTGGTASGNNVTIRSTTNATKGSVIFDETTQTTSSVTGSIRISGGIGISNTTDATSSTNGGTITTAGGLAVAKKAFIGTDLSVGGNITNGSWNANTIAVAYGGTGATSFSTNTVLLGNGTSALQNAAGMTYSSSILTVPSIVSNNSTQTTSSTTGSIRISGGIGISNTTDATSSTNGGTITTAGGLAVAKKAFIGGDLLVGGSLSIVGGFTSPHSNLTGLLNDDHTQYLLLAGRIGGQIIIGGTGSGNDLILRSTTNSTKGSVIIDESTISSSSLSGCLRLSGGIGISNATDAISITNGGTFTTAGGLSVAKKVFIGDTLNTGSITITNSVKNTLTINCQNSSVNPGEIIFSNTAGTGDFSIRGDGGDVVWQGGGGRPMQFGAFHEVRIFGGRTVTTPLPQLSGSQSTFNTVIQNSNNSIGLRIQGVSGQTANLTQWTSSTGTVYSYIDNLGNFISPGIGITGYIEMTHITPPSNPSTTRYRYYTDSSDGLLKSKSSSGSITVYQPCNTKGDLSTHNGTTQVKLPVGGNGSYLQADSSTSTGLVWNTRSSAYFRDLKPQGTNGGAASNGSFFTRTLNEAEYFPSSQSDISLSNNIVTLQQGSYKITGRVPGYRVNEFTSRLVDVSNNNVLILGSAADSDNSTTYSFIIGRLDVISTLSFRIEMRCNTNRNNDGLGNAVGYQEEVYTNLVVEKI